MQLKPRNLINVRRIAIHNRLAETLEGYIEKCYRYFSKTYGVSLFEAKERLSAEEVALIYMEDEMEDWTVESVQELKAEMNEGDRAIMDCAKMIEDSSAIDDDTWIAQQNALLKKQEDLAKKKQSQEAIVKQTHDAIEKLTESFKSITKDLENKKE